ncbi:MAG: rRNA (guanine-N1)-methyltransferase, partial [Azovibrio sp.]|nr:rRNA (guanine-N1)-methyltransferase [Azovibrio sp.]
PEKPASLQPPPGFTPAGEETLAYPLALENQEAIASLLAMTPHQHLAGAEGRARAARLNRLEVDVQVRLKLWRRAPLAG